MTWDDVSDAELVAELERRSARQPVLVACPDCTRTDAIVSIHCANCGLNYFPTRGRVLARLSLAVRRIAEEMARRDVILAELDHRLPTERRAP